MAAEGTTLEELVSRWTIKADLTPLEEGRKALEGLTITLAAMGAHVVASMASLFELANATAEAGAEAEKAAMKFGLTAKAYQELKYAARAEAESLDMGLLFLNKNMDEANKGAKEAKLAFAGLGVTITNGGKLRSANDVLMDIAEKFKKMPNDARRTKAAVDLFGRSGANLIPFLARGREEIEESRKEAEEFGFVISDTEAAEKYRGIFEDLSNIMKGFRNTVGVGLIPVVTELAERFKAWLRINRELIVQKLQAFVAELIEQITFLVGFLGNVYGALSSVARLFGGFTTILKVASRAVIFFMTVLSISYLGKAGMALRGLGVELVALAAKWYAAGWAATLAQIRMLAMPILIGTAIALLLLALEDLYTFFSGSGESVTGKLVENIKPAFKWLMDKVMMLGPFLLANLTQFGVLVGEKILAIIQPVVDAIQWLIDSAKKLTVGGVLSSVARFAEKLNPFASAQNASAASGSAGPTVGNVLGLTPSIASAGGDGSRMMMSKPEINQTINVGDGASALETGKAVGAATENALSQTHREAARTFSAVGDY